MVPQVFGRANSESTRLALCPTSHGKRVKRGDSNGLMDASLRSHRVQACDGEKVTLHCPRNTHIMIETGYVGSAPVSHNTCVSPTLKPSAVFIRSWLLLSTTGVGRKTMKQEVVSVQHLRWCWTFLAQDRVSPYSD
ncbi:hypothetical protein ANCDUO_11536 [Ancylostoma duodenale]|uniref:Uncharacterized protein n=1 Tax=Ancylostoma duodenale TaxID=51022 RepID=A0A0C2GB89_9BILA|nr:hypothetical protein ANCDUO_11536 [Ancylostoma duodenale]